MLLDVPLARLSAHQYRPCGSCLVHRASPATTSAYTRMSTDIRMLGRQGRWQEALRELASMDSRNVAIDPVSWNSALAACKRAGRWREALTLLRNMRQRGLKPDPVAYSTAIGACARGRRWREAIDLLSEMQRLGPLPDIVCYSAAVDALGKGGQWQQALDLMTDMRQHGVMPNVYTYGAAVSATAKACKWKEALALLHQMQTEGGVQPNLHVYNACISACAKAGQWKAALQLLEDMTTNRVQPDVITYGAALDALGHAGDDQSEKALGLLRGMSKHGIRPDLICYSSAAHACAKGGRYKVALQLLEEMTLQGLQPDATIINTTMAACAKAGQASTAMRLLDQLRQQGRADIYSWNTAISACAQASRWQEALLLREEMQEAGVAADAHTWDSCIRACGRAGEWYTAIKLLSVMEKKGGLLPGSRHFCAAIDACAKAGEAETAVRLLDSMGVRGLEQPPHAWTAAMHALGRCGHWEAACDLLQVMQEEGDDDASAVITAGDASRGALRGAGSAAAAHSSTQAPLPTEACYNAAMAACAHAGQWERAMTIFEDMLAAAIDPSETSFVILISACTNRRATAEQDVDDSAARAHAQLRLAREMCMRNIQPSPIVLEKLGRCKSSLKPTHEPATPEEVALQKRVETMLVAALLGAQDTASVNKREGHATLGEIQLLPASAPQHTALEATSGAERAAALMERMKSVGLWPPQHVPTWNAAINACAQDDLTTALTLLQEMRQSGVTPDVVTYNSILNQMAFGQPQIFDRQ